MPTYLYLILQETKHIAYTYMYIYGNIYTYTYINIYIQIYMYYIYEISMIRKKYFAVYYQVHYNYQILKFKMNKVMQINFVLQYFREQNIFEFENAYT